MLNRIGFLATSVFPKRIVLIRDTLVGYFAVGGVALFEGDISALEVGVWGG